MGAKRKRREEAKATRGVAKFKWRIMWSLFLFARAGIAGIAAPLLGGARITRIAALFRGTRITRIAAFLSSARIARLAGREFDDVLGCHGLRNRIRQDAQRGGAGQGRNANRGNCLFQHFLLLLFRVLYIDVGIRVPPNACLISPPFIARLACRGLITTYQNYVNLIFKRVWEMRNGGRKPAAVRGLLLGSYCVRTFFGNPPAPTGYGPAQAPHRRGIRHRISCSCLCPWSCRRPCRWA